MLLLDEPTNHLDTDAKEALETALAEFDGGIITVSHDRYFLDKVCDTIWDLRGDGGLVVWLATTGLQERGDSKTDGGFGIWSTPA